MTLPIKTPLEMKAAQRCDSAVSAHPCQSVIPFYPVRYALRPSVGTGSDFSHGNLRTDFPKLKDVCYVLRLLRPESWLYLYDENNRHKLVCFVYRAPENGPTSTYHYFRVDIDIRNGEHTLLPQAHPNPYIPAYDPKHPPKAISVLLTDAPLSAARTRALNADPALRERSMQRIDLAPWLAAFKSTPLEQETPAPPAVADTLPLLELERQVLELRGQRDDWSEHRTLWANGALPKLDAAMRRQSTGMLAGTRLAIVFNDPIGMLSELNHLVDTEQERLNTFHATTAWPLLSATMVESVANAAQAEGEEKGYMRGMQVSARTGVVPNLKGKYGMQFRRSRLTDVRDDERNAFLRQYKSDLDLYTNLRDAAAQRACDLRRSQRAGLDAAMALYDPADDIGQRALRAAIARTLDFCMVHEETAKEVAAPLEEGGPTGGPFKDVMVGHLGMAAWINTEKLLDFSTGKVADTRLDNLRELQSRLPADAASRRVSVILQALLSKQRKTAPETFWKTPYAAATQALEGSLAERRTLTNAKDVASWLAEQRREAQQAHWRGSPRPPQSPATTKPKIPAIAQHPPTRPTALAHSISDALQVFHETAVEAAANEELAKISRNETLGRRSLGWKLSAWQGGKLGIGGLGLWISLNNVGEAIKKLHKADAQWAVEGVGLAGSILTAASSGALVTQVAFDWKADMAKLRNQVGTFRSAKAGAKVAERYAIAFAGAAAAAYGFRDVNKGMRDWGDDGKAPGITFVGAGVQITEAALAGAWLLGRAAAPELLAVVGIGALARLGTGPVGWGIFALEMLYHAVDTWRIWHIDETRVNTWLARCYWGTGKRTGVVSREFANALSADPVSPFDNDHDEVQEFYAMRYTPKIETSTQFIRKVLNNLLPIADERGTAIREITVTFPGWRAGASQYRVWQHIHPRGSAKPVVREGSKDVNLHGNVGVLTFDADDLRGDTEVAWWPGGLAGHDELFFTAEN